jgi:hypothetical protein
MEHGGAIEQGSPRVVLLQQVIPSDLPAAWLAVTPANAANLKRPWLANALLPRSTCIVTTKLGLHEHFFLRNVLAPKISARCASKSTHHTC